MSSPGPDFTLNPYARPRLERVGKEGEPVFIADSFFRDPQAIVTWVVNHVAFGPGGAAFPGVRAAVPEFLNHALIHALNPVISRIFSVGDDPQLELETSFSIVTHAPGQLQPWQRIPHFDVADQRALAIVVYLCPPHWGGTAFYRHRSTGYETVSPDRNEAYNLRLAQELLETALPEGYPDAQHPLFEQILNIEPVFNRLVMYRSRLLHSATIMPGSPLTSSPGQGRLTITSFLRPA